MHDGSISTIERALQLARSGTCKSVEEIRRVLTAEGYPGVNDHISGPTIMRQLNTALKLTR